MLINHRKILKNLIKVDKRTMFTTRNVANKAVNMNLIRHDSQSGVNGLRTETALNPSTLQNKQSNMATLVACKLHKQAAKDLANDGTGKHTHVYQDVCVQSDCEEKKCSSACDTLLKRRFLGHNTHKPLIGRFSKFIGDVDANGNPDSQYFTRENEDKTINAATVNQYKPNEIKTNAGTTAYVNSSELRNKYEE